MTAQRRRWGINIASLFPWSFGPGGPRRAWAIAQQAGFDGLQIMPMHGWDRPEEEVPSESVLSFEGAWNIGPLYRAMLRAIGWLDHPDPTIKDWLLFGANRERCHDWVLRTARHFNPAIYSQHSLGGWCSQPVEAHPELGRTPDEYLDYPGGIVWDTRHIRRLGRDGKAPPVTDNWRQFLLQLAVTNQIKLIHINASSAELAEAVFLSQTLYEESEFTEMLKGLHWQTRTTLPPVILELAPKPFSSRRKLSSHLAGIRDVLANEYFSDQS